MAPEMARVHLRMLIWSIWAFGPRNIQKHSYTKGKGICACSRNKQVPYSPNSVPLAQCRGSNLIQVELHRMSKGSTPAPSGRHPVVPSSRHAGFVGFPLTFLCKVDVPPFRHGVGLSSRRPIVLVGWSCSVPCTNTVL